MSTSRVERRILQGFYLLKNMITPLDFLHSTKDEKVLEHQKANEKVLEHQKANEEVLEHQKANEEVLEHQK
jgi:hypothetical protein